MLTPTLLYKDPSMKRKRTCLSFIVCDVNFIFQIHSKFAQKQDTLNVIKTPPFFVIFNVRCVLKTALDMHKGKTNISPCDNKSASHWIMLDYFFHV